MVELIIQMVGSMVCRPLLYMVILSLKIIMRIYTMMVMRQGGVGIIRDSTGIPHGQRKIN